MRTARPLGITPDGAFLLVATDDGEELRVPADERLRAALRGDRARLGQLEIDMDSTLRPRDIQARIRAGESPEDVARAAGVPVERIDAFAAPVIAERDHVAGLAQTHPVRRRGETTSHRTLRNAVADALTGRGIDPDTVTWDAWKIEDRRWRVRVGYLSGTASHEALFVFDQGGRFSTAANDDAHWLIGDGGPAHGPQPGRRHPTRPHEEHLLGSDDELALVRAVQSPAASADALPEPESGPAPSEHDDDTEDAYREGELAEVDGVYEIVPVSDMDVLYDMLSSFDEDSVKIYAGLIDPLQDAAPPAPLAGPEANEPVVIEQVSDVVDPDSDEPAAPAPVDRPAQPEQLSLIDDADVPGEPAAPPAKRQPRKRRASVPSWDEIMFGAPRTEE